MAFCQHFLGLDWELQIASYSAVLLCRVDKKEGRKQIKTIVVRIGFKYKNISIGDSKSTISKYKSAYKILK